MEQNFQTQLEQLHATTKAQIGETEQLRTHIQRLIDDSKHDKAGHQMVETRQNDKILELQDQVAKLKNHSMAFEQWIDTQTQDNAITLEWRAKLDNHMRAWRSTIDQKQQTNDTATANIQTEIHRLDAQATHQQTQTQLLLNFKQQIEQQTPIVATTETDQLFDIHNELASTLNHYKRDLATAKEAGLKEILTVIEGNKEMI